MPIYKKNPTLGFQVNYTPKRISMEDVRARNNPSASEPYRRPVVPTDVAMVAANDGGYNPRRGGTLGRICPPGTKKDRTQKSPGRPCTLEFVDFDYIYDLVAEGTPFKHAAAMIGVTYDLWRIWMYKGRIEYDPLYVEFYNTVMMARAEAVRERIEIIRDAGGKDWRAAAFWLERVEKDVFSPSAEIRGSEDAPVEIEVKSTLSLPENEQKEQAVGVLDILKKAGVLDDLPMLQGGAVPSGSG